MNRGFGFTLVIDAFLNIGNHIGANAVVLQGLAGRENSIIGAGRIVIRDVPSNVAAYGNLCKVVRNNE